MERDYDREDRNLWEKNGRRGGLLASEQRHRGTPVKARQKKTGTERIGSRYNDNSQNVTNSGAERSGSRYNDNSQNAVYTSTERIGSRYNDNSQNAVYTSTERSGSRYQDKRPAADKRTGRADHRIIDETKGTRDSRSQKQSRTQNTARSQKQFRAHNTDRAQKVARSQAAATREYRRDRDPVKVALMALAGAVAIAYIIVAVYFGSHFYPGTQVYGIDCSKKTAEQVKQEVIQQIGTYTLTLQERNDKQDVITASDINLQYRDDSKIEQLLHHQNSFVWPIMMILSRNRNLQLETSYDEAGMDQVLSNLNCFLPGNIVAPQDAYRGETDTGYAVVPEVMGTTLDYEKTKSVIMDSLNQGLVSISLEDNDCYLNPTIYQDDAALNEDVEKLNSLLTAHITYDFSDRQEVVDATVIRNWIFKDDQGEYYIDDNHVWEYVAGLAEKYDTFGGSRSFQTSIGTTVELYGGDYGWAMDQDATAEILAADVKAGKTETIEPQYVYTGMSRDENDIGGTYVEVCISRQEMWCYQDWNLIVDTPVVTGNPNKDHATPSGGVWAIDAKMTDYVLKGQGYAAPVSYWMPFNEDVGIHDLQTRYYFGGSIYLSNGSHGCVNTPYDAAQTIYNIVSIGTPVIVYE